MFVGLLVVAVCEGLSVAASAVDSNTTKRPLDDISEANALPVARVTCAKNASGVELEVLCAELSAPETNMHAAAAHKNANMSLNIKTPVNNQLAHRGLSQNIETACFLARLESAIVMVSLRHRKQAFDTNPTAVGREKAVAGCRYRNPWPIFSVPNVPIPLSLNAKTMRCSSRRPTLNV